MMAAAAKQMMISESGWKPRSTFRPKFMKLCDGVENRGSFQRRFPIGYIVSLAGDIGPQSCHWVAKSSKIGTFWATNFFWGGGNAHKSPRSVLLPTDTRHMLKFRKDPFRGVDGIDSKKQHFENRCRLHTDGGQKGLQCTLRLTFDVLLRNCQLGITSKLKSL